MKNVQSLVFILSTWSLALFIVLVPLQLFSSTGLEYVYYPLVPGLFMITYITIMGGLSRLSHRGIARGTFSKDMFPEIFVLRRAYNMCWSQIFYFKPLYFIALEIPIVKNYMFRIFGYKRSTSFSLKSDTWIKDLPLLNVSEGASLSDEVVMGTCICISIDAVYVDGIEVGAKSSIGKAAVLAPGVKIADGCDIEMYFVIGICSKISTGVKIGRSCMVDNYVTIAENTVVGFASYLGLNAVIGADVIVPAGSNIPVGSKIHTQADMDLLWREEAGDILKRVANLRELFRKYAKCD